MVASKFDTYMNKAIVKHINEIQSAMTLVFVGALILSQGIHIFSDWFVYNSIDYGSWLIFFLGLVMVLYGETSFLKIKRSMLELSQSLPDE